MSTLEVRHLEEMSPSSCLGQKWEALTKANPASGFMQSLDWAAFKRRQGLASLHLGVFSDGELVGGVIFYSSAKRNGAGILVAPEGPALPWDNQALATEALGLIIDFVQSRAVELGIMSMRIEPRLIPPVMPLLREFGRAPIDLVPRETLYIDLSQSVEELLAGMKPKGRYNIKLAQRSGVAVVNGAVADGAVVGSVFGGGVGVAVVGGAVGDGAVGGGAVVDSAAADDASPHAICSPDCLKRFYSVLSQASSRDQFAIEPRQFFEQLAEVMVPAGHARILFAEHGGDTLGALLLITYGPRATYLYGGVSNKKRNLMGGYELQWQAMKAAKEAGCTTYDFYGFDPFRAPEHRYARFSQFKSQFGGSVVRFIGAQDYFFLDNVADAFIKVVNETERNAMVHNLQHSMVDNVRRKEGSGAHA